MSERSLKKSEAVYFANKILDVIDGNRKYKSEIKILNKMIYEMDVNKEFKGSSKENIWELYDRCLNSSDRGSVFGALRQKRYREKNKKIKEAEKNKKSMSRKYVNKLAVIAKNEKLESIDDVVELLIDKYYTKNKKSKKNKSKIR